jgi:endonuclease/exonuclease/phosphatase family metal-dependent hydrolase
MRFRLITWNIHKGIGGFDRRYRPERIVDCMAFYRPDLLLLQEVDEGAPRSKNHRQVDLLGEALGLSHRAYQPNVRLRAGHYGNAILSRYPLTDVDHIELSVPLKKRRRALAAHCRLVDGKGHSHRLLLINTHLGLASFERQMQIRRILESDVVRHTHRHTAAILAGDMNDVWGRLGRVLIEPAGFVPACGAIKTFPAYIPMRALDRIYYRGGLALRNSHAARAEIARRASDHLPLIADFELR